MPRIVTLLPGDGIGRELVEPVLRVLEAVRPDVVFERAAAGRDAYRETGTALPAATLESIRRNRVALAGKLLARADDPYPSPRSDLRRRLDLFAAVLPIRNLRGLPARHHDVDIVVIRQATEDIYAGLEHRIRDGIVATLKVVTAAASTRITRFAFEWARRYGRRDVTLVHKANIMKVTDGLFIETAEQVAAEYPDIGFRKMIVDAACMQIMMRPSQFDVLLMGNLYGSIISDLGAGIVGGISASFGAALNEQIAVFEALHGDAPHLEGTGRGNPLPLLLPALNMLEHLGERDKAEHIRAAVGRTLERGVRTPDLGGASTADELARTIIGEL
ncbi:MAG: isocitrate/isopropylmalate dehydrogenase family protein [Deltaproteobacteria bacterium]|nr:isocitrate/isopropylmalate dehydrogenase family protein [Deltaproteobacteria bacterium]